jgi:hypothetical protein
VRTTEYDDDLKKLTWICSLLVIVPEPSTLPAINMAMAAVAQDMPRRKVIAGSFPGNVNKGFVFDDSIFLILASLASAPPRRSLLYLLFFGQHLHKYYMLYIGLGIKFSAQGIAQ